MTWRIQLVVVLVTLQLGLTAYRLVQVACSYDHLEHRRFHRRNYAFSVLMLALMVGVLAGAL